MKIAIVGFGITGSSVLKTLVTSGQFNEDDQIDVFEYRQKLASGFPFDDDASTIHMNSYAQDVSADPNRPRDFIEWLDLHYPNTYQADSFAPRAIYGDYIQDRFLKYAEPDYVHVVPQYVSNMRVISDQQYQLQVDNHEWIPTIYNTVFLCIGSAPYADHYHLIGAESYIHNPFPVKDVLDNLPTDKRIGVIGSGLTALDIQFHLQSRHEFQHPVTFYIRNSPFTTLKKGRYQKDIVFSMSRKWLSQQKERHHGQIPLDNIFKLIAQDFAENHINWRRLNDEYGKGTVAEVEFAINTTDLELSKLHAYLLKLTPYLPDLYMSLPASDRRLFNNNYSKQVQHFRSQIPAERMKVVLDNMDKGQLAFVSGLINIEADADGFKVYTENGHVFQIDILINAAGLELDLETAGEQDALIHNLYEQEILMANNGSHALVEWPTCHVMSQRYGRLNHVFLFGSWISNTQYSNNNVGLNLKQAQESTKWFLNHI